MQQSGLIQLSVEKQAADLQRRAVHDVGASGRYRVHLDLNVVEGGLVMLELFK